MPSLQLCLHGNLPHTESQVDTKRQVRARVDNIKVQQTTLDQEVKEGVASLDHHEMGYQAEQIQKFVTGTDHGRCDNNW